MRSHEDRVSTKHAEVMARFMMDIHRKAEARTDGYSIEFPTGTVPVRFLSGRFETAEEAMAFAAWNYRATWDELERQGYKVHPPSLPCPDCGQTPCQLSAT